MEPSDDKSATYIDNALPEHNVLRTSPNGPILVETFWTKAGPK